MNTYFHSITAKYFTEGQPFNLHNPALDDTIQYPANWLTHATPDDLAALGLELVQMVGTPADTRYYNINTETMTGAVRTITSTPRDRAEVLAEVAAQYSQALESHYDAKAQERRYDSRFTAALRAGYAGPFQGEGMAFAQWMDACNYSGYTMLAAATAAAMAAPTFEAMLAGLPTLADVIAQLPALTWP